MKLKQIALREIQLPLREPFRISSGEVRERRIALVELVDADGHTAWSECVAGERPNYSSETIDTAWFAIANWLAPQALAMPFEHAAELRERLDAGVRGHRMAKAAIEMGCWTLEAERAGVALAELLGGVRDRIEVGISLGIQPTPSALVERALAAAAQGYRRIKLKIAPHADLPYVAAVREAVGPDVMLTVDANSAYTLDDIARLQQLDALHPAMIEQPLDAEDIVRHAELQRSLRTPLCLDESITSRARAEDMITLGAARIINIKPGRVGGLAESVAIHDLCTEHGVPVWCGGLLESGIGRAYNVALASLHGFSMPGDVSPSARYWTRDIVTPEWTMNSGEVTVPLDRPGLGVSVDTHSIDQLTVRMERFGAP